MTFFARIAALIHAEKEAILGAWSAAVRESPPAALRRARLSEEELRDHLPAVLDDLARAMCGEETPSVEKDGARHGDQRRRLGYQVDECLAELHVFRRVLLDSIDARREVFAGTTHDQVCAMRRRLLDLFDRSVRASVRQYIRDAEGERDRAQERLEALNRELQESHAQKDRFLAVLTHELRNPLAPIVTAAAVLKGADLPPERRQRACEIIERQAQYQKRLLDDLLDINRIERGVIELQREVLDLRDGVRHALESCRPAIEAKVQHLATTLPAEPVQVLADRVRIAQVITNLLGNASKFTPADGSIALLVRSEGDDAVLAVRDDGPGIAPEMLARIFELFAQVGSSAERNSTGLGVGLWLARRLVEMQGGTLEATSPGLGRGALFTLRLPLAARSPDRA